jgi:hypothetical protein
MAKTIAQVSMKIYDELTGLGNEDERLRAVNAALTLFGDKGGSPNRVAGADGGGLEADGVNAGLAPAARRWQKQHGIKQETIEAVFHMEKDHTELIGEPPGKSKREKTLNTYVLTGIAAYLKDGSANFADDAAKSYCEHFGCYDSPNHAKYLTMFGNKITGSKTGGWKLTAPGLTYAAQVLKAMAEDGE